MEQSIGRFQGIWAVQMSERERKPQEHHYGLKKRRVGGEEKYPCPNCGCRRTTICTCKRANE
jgi:hypothetical protein